MNCKDGESGACKSLIQLCVQARVCQRCRVERPVLRRAEPALLAGPLGQDPRCCAAALPCSPGGTVRAPCPQAVWWHRSWALCPSPHTVASSNRSIGPCHRLALVQGVGMGRTVPGLGVRGCSRKGWLAGNTRSRVVFWFLFPGRLHPVPQHR